MIKKEIIVSSLGNIVEWFDFGIFIFMAPIIGAKFFPIDASTHSTLDALIVFTVGFLCRPLGGIVFGYFGDTHGRVKTIRISILTITVPTLLMGLLPSYETIGSMATLLFIVLRLLQGLSIGGEYSGIMVYLAESSAPHQRGFVTSFAATGANLGFLLATLTLGALQLLFSQQTMTDWAWRLPFILIGFPAASIFYYRFKLPETEVYDRLQRDHRLMAMPLVSAFKAAPYQLLKILGLTCMGATNYYVFVGFMPFYLQTVHGFSSMLTLTIQSIILIMMLIAVPIAGICGDRFSRKAMLMMTAMLIMLWVFPCFYLLNTHSLLWVLLALTIATLLSAFDQGNTLTAVVENCPENVRYSGIAFSYNLGNALLGGTAPLVVTVLIQQLGPIAPAYYLFIMTFVTFMTARTLLKNNAVLGPI